MGFLQSAYISSFRSVTSNPSVPISLILFLSSERRTKNLEPTNRTDVEISMRTVPYHVEYEILSRTKIGCSDSPFGGRQEFDQAKSWISTRRFIGHKESFRWISRTQVTFRMVLHSTSLSNKWARINKVIWRKNFVFIHIYITIAFFFFLLYIQLFNLQ